jgi:hypothetical protein
MERNYHYTSDLFVLKNFVTSRLPDKIPAYFNNALFKFSSFYYSKVAFKLLLCKLLHLITQVINVFFNDRGALLEKTMIDRVRKK